MESFLYRYRIVIHGTSCYFSNISGLMIGGQSQEGNLEDCIWWDRQFGRTEDCNGRVAEKDRRMQGIGQIGKDRPYLVTQSLE